MRGKKTLIVVVFAAIAVTVAASSVAWQKKGTAYRISYKTTRYNQDGTVRDIEPSIRLVESTGAVRTWKGGSDVSSYTDGEGIEWLVSDAKQEMMLYRQKRADAPKQEPLTREVLESHNQLVRKEQLLGYRVYVLSSYSVPGQAYAEVYAAPEFGHAPLKVVSYDGDGTRLSVTEAQAIEAVTTGQIAAPPVSYRKLTREAKQ